MKFYSVTWESQDGPRRCHVTQRLKADALARRMRQKHGWAMVYRHYMDLSRANLLEALNAACDFGVVPATGYPGEVENVVTYRIQDDRRRRLEKTPG